MRHITQIKENSLSGINVWSCHEQTNKAATD